jgi:2-amino-4-hydroxy-6-hydroxymethyldihydropteridine diphosphokinase
MRYVLLAGSNEQAQARLAQARLLLHERFGVLRFGDVVQSPDRDTDAARPYYLNQAIEIATPMAPAELKLELRNIEASCGRERPATRTGRCAMDLDITLCYQARWIWLDEKAQSQDYARLALHEWI